MKLSEKAVKLIEGKNFAHLATLMADGSPQVTPVWVDREGDLILVNTAEGRVKYWNVKRDPRVALSVYNQQNPYERIVIRGRVMEITNQGADEHIDKMAEKYTGRARYQRQRSDEKRVLFKIRAENVAA